jgi:hypothetical protein
MAIDCGFCFSGYDGDDMPLPFMEQWRTARKPNRCDECKRPIQPGELYNFAAGCWDGDWNAYKTCAVCHEIRKAFSCDGSWTYMTLWDDLEQSFEGLTTGCFDKLTTAAAKAYLRDRWLAWKELA